MASCFPLVAFGNGKMRAMPRKRPAVVQRPYHLYVVLFYVVEQHREIDTVHVEIVKMDNIGGEAFEIVYKLSCSPA